jgi:hypothetical protein
MSGCQEETITVAILPNCHNHPSLLLSGQSFELGPGPTRPNPNHSHRPMRFSSCFHRFQIEYILPNGVLPIDAVCEYHSVTAVWRTASGCRLCLNFWFRLGARVFAAFQSRAASEQRTAWEVSTTASSLAFSISAFSTPPINHFGHTYP